MQPSCSSPVMLTDNDVTMFLGGMNQTCWNYITRVYIPRRKRAKAIRPIYWEGIIWEGAGSRWPLRWKWKRYFSYCMGEGNGKLHLYFTRENTWIDKVEIVKIKMPDEVEFYWIFYWEKAGAFQSTNSVN